MTLLARIIMMITITIVVISGFQARAAGGGEGERRVAKPSGLSQEGRATANRRRRRRRRLVRPPSLYRVPRPPPHSALAPALRRRWRRRRASARSPHKRRRDKHPPPAGTKDGSAGRDSGPSRSPGSPRRCSRSLRTRLPVKRRGAPSTVPLWYYCGGAYFLSTAHLTVHTLVS
ncbi:serine/arginine repetitive matrix protein 1-like [Peromyscus eremicus]|uniref:serine/arginine repetitive matrix protein 1-like n=1 Tax=Peromyscus eremicus TaxID=42410 RepID=UPI0027DDDD5E|nr:serine/arginine repetitive matrix protein 1-like [Peromyscus eremicus]